ncbi:TonB-dependent receptor [Catenovulum sp. 2E275]|uniref:TonB-dependent receptor n=1 Tax=Catenovulum sp. 2E275 TaxID=2980497 RepID=UPI0021D02E64|nr:TonB-dependent receptor [Catenovulum sp. 2E275]MCU4675252.1 TonB-dependent receptor [Catenovulum sp. 2E275]
MYFKFKPVTFFVGAVCTFSVSSAFADHQTEIIHILGHSALADHSLDSLNNTLQKKGVDMSAAGGMSALPVINGLMADRVKVLLDGADVTAACANQMNPPLSYVSANQVEDIEVFAGITPVSMAGDNIAGVIKVNSIHPNFSNNQALSWQSGYFATEYQSVNQAQIVGLGAEVSSAQWSVAYQGAYQNAKSYQNGQGEKELDTLYRGQNHHLITAYQQDNQSVAVKLNYQYIPFQGFANQYMDMTHNQSIGMLTQYKAKFDSAEFNANVNWHKVEHEMGFFSAEKTGMMPMNTKGSDFSYRLSWLAQPDQSQNWLIGHEYFNHKIDDWWPAIEGSMMMGPNDYINLNNAKRQRVALFAEYNQRATDYLKWQLGIRAEQVTTNADEVQAYSDMPMMGMANVDHSAAQAFNQAEHKIKDNVLDLNLTAHYRINAHQQIEAGIAHKNRAPNLYERYSWGQGAMASSMIGWYGDGNGYVGNLNLKPETADTISATYHFMAESGLHWQANVWYSKISDYIDANIIGEFNRSGLDNGKRHILQFENTDATLSGAKFNAVMPLGTMQMLGDLNAEFNAALTQGERDSGTNLYQIKPIETQLSLTQTLNQWKNTLSWQWVGAKKEIDELRLENATQAYHLLHLTSTLELDSVTLKLAINNLLDEYYQLPLGGVNIARYNADPQAGFSQINGAGRSLNLGIQFKF